MISRSRIVLFLATLLLSFGLFSPAAHANYPDQGLLLAQMDPEEAYDPFIDYSEFDEESDEEADINFFRNGRFLTMGMAAGTRGFTGNLSDIYGSGLNFGLSMAYFFDLRLALSLGFQTGDHAVSFKTNLNNQYDGNVSLTSINVDLKYYFNTQNVTRGLADLNPYLLGGIGQYYRTYNISDQPGFSKDNTMGFSAGAGIEIPILRKKSFLGLQAVFHKVDFADENKRFIGGTEFIEKAPSGDFYTLSAIIGMNF